MAGGFLAKRAASSVMIKVSREHREHFRVAIIEPVSRSEVRENVCRASIINLAGALRRAQSAMTTTRDNATFTDELRFEVLGLVSIALPGPWWWHTEDMNDLGAVGAIFRCYEKGNENELGYLLVADLQLSQTSARLKIALFRNLTVFLNPRFAVSWHAMDARWSVGCRLISIVAPTAKRL